MRVSDGYEVERYMRETKGGQLLSGQEFIRLAQAVLSGEINYSPDDPPSTMRLREMLRRLDQDMP